MTSPSHERSRSAPGDRFSRDALRVVAAAAQRHGNAEAMRARHESLEDITLRDATAADIPAIAARHVTARNDADAPMMRGPGIGVRANQWRKAFPEPTG